MTIRKIFRDAIAGIRRRRIEPDPFPSAPGVSLYDASVILGESARRRFEDVIFYGPGADAANERRADAIARREARVAKARASRIPATSSSPAKETAASSSPKKPTKRRLSKAERLERRAEKLKAEIAALKVKK